MLGHLDHSVLCHWFVGLQTKGRPSFYREERADLGYFDEIFIPALYLRDDLIWGDGHILGIAVPAVRGKGWVICRPPTVYSRGRDDWRRGGGLDGRGVDSGFGGLRPEGRQS